MQFLSRIVYKNIFQIPYKEDWEAEKQLVYYPVHITPGYEASSDVKKIQSDVSFCSVTQQNPNKIQGKIQILLQSCCVTPKRLKSLPGSLQRHCVQTTQLCAKKCCSGGETLARSQDLELHSQKY